MRLSRLFWVGGAAVAYGLLVYWVSTANSSPAFLNVRFAVLQSLLLVGSAQWWVNPLRGSYYDYTSPLALVSVWTFVFFGLGSVPVWAEPSLRPVTGNPGAIEHFPAVLAPVVTGIFVWDWVYRTVHRKAVPIPQRSVRTDGLGPNIKALFLFWVLVALLGYAYLAVRYTPVGLGFAAVGADQADALATSFDQALNQIIVELILFSWALCVVVVIRARRTRWRWTGMAGALAMLVLVVSTLSRRRVLIAGLILLGLVLYLKRPSRARFRSLLLRVAGAVVVLGMLVSGLRVGYGLIEGGKREFGTTPGGLIDAARLLESNPQSVRAGVGQISQYTLAGRLAGLDLLAGVQESRSELGVSFLRGKVNLLAATKVVPSFVWPDKPTRDPKSMSREHLSLPDLDHVNTVVSSAYLDFGALGVVAGFALFALLMSGVEAVIWHQSFGTVLYFGTLIYPANYETYVLSHPLLWLRFVLLVGVVSYVVLGIASALRTMRSQEDF